MRAADETPELRLKPFSPQAMMMLQLIAMKRGVPPHECFETIIKDVFEKSVGEDADIPLPIARAMNSK